MSILEVRKAVTSANDAVARNLNQWFRRHGIFVLNIISSPGAGKTTLLEKTTERLGTSVGLAVVVGDPYTSLDCDRLRGVGAVTTQIVTGGGCHLDAAMVQDAVRRLDLTGIRLLIIENVGNLLCPAAWDLGQDATVVVTCPTEGEDKPLKYPETFLNAQAMVINKMDLAPHLPCDAAALEKNAMTVNPRLAVFRLSCLTGAGLDRWWRWVVDGVSQRMMAEPAGHA